MKNIVKEKEHIKRLENNNIMIEEVYEKIKNKKRKKYIRRSDSDLDESIINCYLKEKRYYLNGKLLATDDSFGKENTYTYLSFKNQNLKFECPNCGYNDFISKFYNGCPYCNSSFFIDYEKTQMPVADRKAYDDLKFIDKNGRKLFVIISIVILLAINIFLIIDRSMVLLDIIFMIIFDLLLFIPILTVGLYNIKVEGLNKRDQILSKQEQDLNYVKSKKKFYNDVHDLIFEYMYTNPNNKDVVDFNIISYNDLPYSRERILSYNADKDLSVTIMVFMKKVYFRQNDFEKDYVNYWVTVQKNENYKSDLFKFQKLQCKNCGSPLTQESDECPSCGQKYSIPKEWELVDISKVEEI